MGHPQVFEFSAVLRMIYTRGALRANRVVIHPITQWAVRRDLAFIEIAPVEPSIQCLITRHRERLGLGREDDMPITSSEDRQRFVAVLWTVLDP